MNKLPKRVVCHACQQKVRTLGSYRYEGRYYCDEDCLKRLGVKYYASDK